MQVNYLCFFATVLFGAIIAKKLPSFVEPCPRSMKDVGDCILKNIELLKPRLAKGIPELAIPSLNPLIIPKATLDTNGFVAGFADIKMFHLNEFIISNFKFNLDTLKIEISINFPYFEARHTYRVKGKLLLLQVDNSGDCYGNFTNSLGNLTGTGVLLDKKGKKYINIKDIQTEVHIEDAYLYFYKLFGDNEELTVNANKVLNENIHAVLEEFLPVANGVVQAVVIGIANTLFNKFSFDELFPDS